MTERELELRRDIFESFAATGAPPDVADEPALDGLAEQHVVVLDRTGSRVCIHMAHPFAAHHDGARVDAGGRTWWGSCAWDALGIVAALGLRDAVVTSHGVTVRVEAGAVRDDAVFHIALRARHWWDDIGFT